MTRVSAELKWIKFSNKWCSTLISALKLPLKTSFSIFSFMSGSDDTNWLRFLNSVEPAPIGLSVLLNSGVFKTISPTNSSTKGKSVTLSSFGGIISLTMFTKLLSWIGSGKGSYNL